jgi:hypothetical protein
LARQDVNDCHRFHPAHLEQRTAQFIEHLGAERRCVDVDVRRHHLHSIEVEVAPTQQRQNFLGDADAVDKGDVDAHGTTGLQGGGRQYARSAGLS